MATRTGDDYREVVRRLILEYTTHKVSHGDIKTEAVMDEERGHYEALNIGWDGERRIHGCFLHVDVIDDKIWIQHDGTSPGIANDLLEAGIPRSAIILGFHPEYVRQHTGFAIC